MQTAQVPPGSPAVGRCGSRAGRAALRKGFGFVRDKLRFSQNNDLGKWHWAKKVALGEKMACPVYEMPCGLFQLSSIFYSILSTAKTVINTDTL